MDDFLLSKAAVRETITRRLKILTPQALKTQGLSLSRRIGAWARDQGFQTVLATLPLPGEPDLTPFLVPWMAGGGTVALARTGPGRHLEFRYVPNLDGPWEPRPFGLREPALTAPLWTPGPRTLVLVPGLAFAPAPGGGFYRLGRGAGYYDRWLANFGSAVYALGIALTEQYLPEVPVEPHDQKLTGLVTPGSFFGGTGG